jgi:hypothetical protein
LPRLYGELLFPQGKVKQWLAGRNKAGQLRLITVALERSHVVLSPLDHQESWMGRLGSKLYLAPLPSRLAALIRPFLEPNFPRRWLNSDVGVDVRHN